MNKADGFYVLLSSSIESPHKVVKIFWSDHTIQMYLFI